MTRSRVLSGPVERRRFLGGLTGAAAALGLTACGVSESDGKASDGGSKEPSGAATRSLETDNGTVKVPTDPKRVVVLENYDALMLLDLGIVPVGIPDGAANPQLLPEENYEQLKDVATIGASGTPNSQAIAALKPDLIIDQFYKEKSAPLKTIAPVAYFDWHTSGAFWNEQIAKVAKAVNREKELAAKKKQYEARLAEVKSAYRKQIETTTWAPLSGGPSGKFFLGTPLVTVMRDVGLRIGAGLPEKEAGFVPKSYEEMDVLKDCDALIYSVQADGKPTPTTQALLDHKLWKGVPAVKAGRAFPSRHFVMANYTFAIATVDEIEGMLKKMQ
ncbi:MULTISPECIES: ABC transporter substrate-binding protein [Streptomyces]|uniref:ABC transporter substrate-binding protein n=1 Tax=Streptomyces parvus TaxID=66428 RepID=A0A5D4IG30_9ACTN|nr:MULTISPECIES: ABC transporter substrate-binding protein [Streptomyces]PVC82330.1 iron ABC transporter substrate-binding protein [Streptomyces sp. CS014]TYR52087.1 ABC transporter substrate-binding protein [Streptomyces parvus]